MNAPADETLDPAVPAATAPKTNSWKKWTIAAASVWAAFYFVTSLLIASRRLLWFDEIVTVLIAKLPSTSRIVDALAHADNNMPAPYFLVVHAFFKLLGVSPVVARLPSALAFTIGLLIVFDCVRRLTGGLYGLLAMAVLSCTALPYYGYEARSYGLYFMLAAFGFWIWVHGKRNILSAALFGIALFLSIMVHYYAVLGLAPYAIWEAREWKRWRMPSPNLIAGVIACFGAALVLIPQMSGAKRYSSTFWSPPTPLRLHATFTDLIPEGLFLLAIVMIWVALSARLNGATAALPMESAERIGWLGFVIPFLGYSLAKLVTNAYVSRYFLAMLAFVAVAFACWAWRSFQDTPIVPIGILLILAAFGIKDQLATTRHPEFIDPFNQQSDTIHAFQMEPTLRAEGKRFTVLTNGLLYLALWYNAKHPEQYVLLIPSPGYLETHNTPRYVSGLGRLYPMQFWNVDDLRKHAAETVLLDPNEDTWRILKQAGIATQVRFTAPIEADYFR